MCKKVLLSSVAAVVCFALTAKAGFISSEKITASASSSIDDRRDPRGTIDASDLDRTGRLHSRNPDDCWLSQPTWQSVHWPEPYPGRGRRLAWLKYEFDEARAVKQMWVWNFGCAGQSGRGLRKAFIEYSPDGLVWSKLKNGAKDHFVIPRSEVTKGTNDVYPVSARIDFANKKVKAVLIVADTIANGGTWGDDYFGLAEVQFLASAPTATVPEPFNGSDDIPYYTTLRWVPGTGAESHVVYLGTDVEAVTNARRADPGEVEYRTVRLNHCTPQRLEPGRTYYWRVDELTNSKVVRGKVWSFRTIGRVSRPGKGQARSNNEDVTLIWDEVGQAQADSLGQRDKPSYPGLGYTDLFEPFYSAALRRFASPQDWSKADVGPIYIWFNAANTNSYGPLFAVLQDVDGNESMVKYGGNANASEQNSFSSKRWRPWSIKLRDFVQQNNDFNLAKVQEVFVGANGCYASVAVSHSDEEVNLPYMGKVKPRPASEIKSSNWSVGAETMDRDYTIYKYWKSHLGPLGIKKARIQAGWAKTEQKKGVYNWEWLDEIVFDMAEQGVEPWMCLCYGNPVYSGGGGARLSGALPRSEEALQAWQTWVGKTVTRYKEVIDEWEVWNEPHGKANPPARYADFLIRTAEVVKGIQENAKVLQSLIGINLSYCDRVLKYLSNKGKLHLLDQITYHPYDYNPDEVYDRVAKLRQLIGRYSNRIIIRQGENGAPSYSHASGVLANYPWTERTQAKWALRRLLGDLGRDIPSSYFAIIDMRYPTGVNSKGLIAVNEDKTVHHRKEAYYAVQALASIFDDKLRRIRRYSYTIDQTCPLSVFGYENKYSGAQVVTIWFDDSVPAISNKKTNVDLTFYHGEFSDPVYVDLREAKVYAIPAANWSRCGSVYKFRNVPCYDSVILIADRSNIALR